MTTSERFVSVSYVARELGNSPRTVERWCRDGVVPGAWRVGRGPWRIPVSFLRDLKARINATSAAVQPIKR